MIDIAIVGGYNTIFPGWIEGTLQTAESLLQQKWSEARG